MTNHATGWRASGGATVGLALVSSVFFAALFWIWERNLLWMLAVILPPIWSPLIYQRYTSDASQSVNSVVVVGLVTGLAVLACIGLAAYALS